MKCFTSWQRYEPDTTTGHKIILTQTFTSFDEKEINELESMLKENVKDGMLTDYEVKV